MVKTFATIAVYTHTVFSRYWICLPLAFHPMVKLVQYDVGQ